MLKNKRIFILTPVLALAGFLFFLKSADALILTPDLLQYVCCKPNRVQLTIGGVSRWDTQAGCARVCGPEGSTCMQGSCTAAEPAPEPVETFEPVLPRLQIPVPTITPFTEPLKTTTAEGETVLVIDFLAQYLIAIYRYLVSIAGIMAGVMIVWAGVKWLTSGGSPDKIGDAKQKIAGALVGLILVLGSYVILQVINPELVIFKPLRVEVVERKLLDLDFYDSETSVPEGPPTARPLIDPSRIQKITDHPCIRMATGVLPEVITPLRRAMDKFCELRGNNPWIIRGGGYRSPTTQLKLFIERCLGREQCATAVTGNPLQAGVIIRENGIRVPADPNLKQLARNPDLVKNNYNTLFNALAPLIGGQPGGHQSGVALDIACAHATNKDKDGTPAWLGAAFKGPYVPCQLLLEQAMKEAGFCRLEHEMWHFELNEFRATVRSCNINWTIGAVKPDFTNTRVPAEKRQESFNYSQCQGIWNMDPKKCG